MAEPTANLAAPCQKAQDKNMFDQEILASQVTADRFPSSVRGKHRTGGPQQGLRARADTVAGMLWNVVQRESECG